MAEELTPEICVIGGGPGGIAVAMGAAEAGRSVILVEKNRLGGANLTHGGLPLAALRAAATVHDTRRRAPTMGAVGDALQVDWSKLKEHIDTVVASVASNVSAERLTALGATVLMGTARFTDRRTLVVGEQTIRARRFVVAVGAVLTLPDLPGLDAVDSIAEEGIFAFSEPPSHLVVLGAGPHGLALAQAYRRLGVETTIVDPGPALAGEDPEVVSILVDRLKAEGVGFFTGMEAMSFARRRGGVRVTGKRADEDEETAVEGSHLIVTGSRRPNIADLGLAEAGVAFDVAGVGVDRQLRTSNHSIYAIGDAVAGPALANRAEYHAALLLEALAHGRPIRDDPALVPSLTFTDPELASIGLREVEATRRGKIAILRMPFVENDRAQAERQPEGMIKVMVAPGGTIVGATVIGRGAGELISTWSLAVANKLPIGAMRRFSAPYPTRAALSRRVAASFRGVGLTGSIWQRIIGRFRNRG